MEAKGKKYLKIVGILMIVFGAISTIVSLLGLLGGGLLLANGVGGAEGGALSGFVVILSLFSLVFAVLELVTGIIGAKNCEKTEKAGLCLKLGITLVALSIISSVGSMITNGFSITAVISLLIGLILPALFCYGAKLNQEK